MLSPNEFNIGYISGAIGLTLVVPTGPYGYHLRVTTAHTEPTAVVLDERDAFVSFASRDNKAYKGVLIPTVRIELDETSGVDDGYRSAALGMIVRREEGLYVCAKPEGRGYGSRLVTLQTGLSAGEPGMAVGFARWRIVIGAGDTYRILRAVDIEAATQVTAGRPISPA
jgi:hypothetical protein